jgi:negative regulator of flagellin synthesis FlgM
MGSGRVDRRSTGSVQGGGSTADTAPGADSGDNVHITGTASTLATLEQALRDLPAVDETRVAATRSAIEQGTYTISPQRIADQLIKLEQSLKNLANGDDPQQPPPNT